MSVLNVRTSKRCSQRTAARRGPWCVVLEGLDGSGKSALASELATRLGATCLATPLRDLKAVRPMVDRVFGEVGLARTLWYAAHVAEASAQAKRLHEQGDSVVIDRYWMSTLAYAHCQGSSLTLEEVLNQLHVPDLTVLIQAEPALRVRRLSERPCLAPHDKAFMDPRRADQLLQAYRTLGTRPEAGRFVEIHLPDAPVARNAERLWRVVLSELSTGPLISRQSLLPGVLC